MFGKIVSATERVDVVAPQVLTAMEIARRSGGRCFLLHVPESPVDGDVGKAAPGPGEELSAAGREAKRQLENTYGGLVRPGDRFEILVSGGRPWEAVGSCAGEKGADLIVVGAHGSGEVPSHGKRAADLSGAGLGSTAQGVIMGEHCPVMVVGPHVARGAAFRGEFGRIMVCMDFSPSCERALVAGRELAGETGGTLYLFNMLPTAPWPKYDRETYRSMDRRSRKRLELLGGAAPPGVSVEYAVRSGAWPHLSIMEFASEKGVDLIVMGSHTKAAVEYGPPSLSEHLAERGCRWYVGSAVEKVGRGARCPLLVVTAPPAAADRHSRLVGEEGRRVESAPSGTPERRPES